MKIELPPINYKKIELLHSITLIIIVMLLTEFISITFISVVMLLSLWSLAIALNQVKKPSIFAGNILAILTTIGLFLDIGFSDTVNLFVAMLLLSTSLKQLISTKILHFKTICLTQLFLIASVYLYQQSLFASILTFIFFITNVATLNLIISPNTQIKNALKRASTSLLFSLPIAFLFFVLLPRLPSFWSLPGPEVATTGLNENIDPFSISKLSKSNELVFRAKFNEEQPSAPYYWRSMVHEVFSDQTWKITNIAKTTASKSFINYDSKIEYEVIAEKSSLHWLYALDYANSNTEYVDNKYSGLLARQKNLSQTFKYNVTSFRLNSFNELGQYQKSLNLKLPESNNKTAIVANELKQYSKTDEEYVSNLYQYFVNEGFTYTLEPPALFGTNKLDQFLLESKRGFCGHYASLSAFMFRSVGIPARVVSGYLGGELSENKDYLSVYQYDAHAWTEVWLENKGWTRFDATSVVSPDRLNGSLSQSEANKDEFMRNLDFGLLSLQNFPMLNWLRLNLENIDFIWTNWVLGFNAQEQKSFINYLFGSNNLIKLAITVIGIITGFLIVIYLYITWKNRPQYNKPLEYEFNKIKTWGEKNDIYFDSGITPQTYLMVLIKKYETKSKSLQHFLNLYIEVRYQGKTLTKTQQKHASILVKSIIKN